VAIVEKTVRLSSRTAAQLGSLAAQTGASEDALIEQAVEILFALLAENDAELSAIWQQMGAPALYEIWENEQDQIYDNWRELYNVSER
jgi:predicted transcriptional regulator